MNYLSMDIGTTCCKCQLFSENGEILEYKSVEYSLMKANGEIYVDIEAIKSHVMTMIAEIAVNHEFASVCISTIGESFVLLDKDDKMLFAPMLYTDPRGEKEAEEVSAQFGNDKLFRITGVLPQSMYSVYKLLWIKKHKPEIFVRAKKVMLMCDYLGYLFTGERIIDYALASRTGAFDIVSLRFSEEILNGVGISPEMFSRPAPTGSLVGKFKQEICNQLNIKNECYMVLGSHDQICASLGAGVVCAGDAVDGMGTVECITTVFDKRPEDLSMGEQGYPCVPYAVEGLYCTYMLNYTNGSLTSWFKNELMHGYKGEEKSFFEYIERDMENRPTDILLLPYFGGAATPFQNINAKGAVVNLTTQTKDWEFYRSIMEGTSMEMRLNIETCSRYQISVKNITATGGGANSRRWLQCKADILNLPIRTLRSSEGGLCGCAMLQAVAMKKVKDLSAAAKIFVRYREQISPDFEMHAKYANQYNKYKNLYKNIKEFY